MCFLVFSANLRYYIFYGPEIVKIYSTDHCGPEMYEI